MGRPACDRSELGERSGRAGAHEQRRHQQVGADGRGAERGSAETKRGPRRRGRVKKIAAVTGTRIHAKCSLITTAAPAQQEARPTRLGSRAASRNAVTAKGKQGVAEQKSKLTCIEPVVHERVKGVE